MDKVQCRNCGALVQANAAACPACGAPLAGPIGASAEAGQGDLRQFLDTANASLVEAGAKAAESAFGLGCSLGFMVSFILLAVVFLLGVRNWIVLAIVGFGGVLLTLVAASVVSGQAKRANIEGAYERRVRRQIDQHLYTQGLTRQEFDAYAHRTLAGDAPLRELLALPPIQPEAPTEE